MKDTLRTTIVARLMPSFAPRLRGVAWVDALDVHAMLLCLVVSEREQVRERPPVELSFVLDVLVPFSSSHLRRFADVREVLKDDRCTLWCAVHDEFGEHMVTGPVATATVCPNAVSGAFWQIWCHVLAIFVASGSISVPVPSSVSPPKTDTWR